VKFGTQMHSCNVSKTCNAKKNLEKGAWPRSRDPINLASRPRDLKFGTQMHSCNVSKTRNAKKNLEKGRGLGQGTPINFGVHPNISAKRVELET